MNAVLKDLLPKFPRVLHAGAGGSKVPGAYFPGFAEVTLDIDPRCQPDMVGSMVDMDFVPDETFEAAYTSHTLEHVYPHEVRRCLFNFLRVLKPGGCLVVTVPNLENVRPTGDVLYESKSGPICGLDMFYGHHALIEQSPYMAHKCGFIPETLREAVESVGFVNVRIDKDEFYNLTAIAQKAPKEQSHV